MSEDKIRSVDDIKSNFDILLNKLKKDLAREKLLVKVIFY